MYCYSATVQAETKLLLMLWLAKEVEGSYWLEAMVRAELLAVELRPVLHTVNLPHHTRKPVARTSKRIKKHSTNTNFVGSSNLELPVRRSH